MREKVAMLVHRAALNRDIGPQHSQRRIQPRGAVDDDEFRRLQATFDKIVEERSPGCLAFAAHILDRQRIFWPSCRTPSATSSEMDVAFRSSRTRTTVPSRINRTIGSSASERPFQASQSPFTLRQPRLTVSFPTAPPNKAASARRTRRVLVPAK